jgi:hypothetical protein
MLSSNIFDTNSDCQKNSSAAGVAVIIDDRGSESITVSDLSFLAAVHSAKEIAKREHISTVFVCK